MFCDEDPECCKYRMAESVDKLGLPIAVRNAIFHIFQDLSSEELMKECSHGKPQNNNEALRGNYPKLTGSQKIVYFET